MYIEKLNVTTEEFQNSVNISKTLILPVGSYEQHSKFMPLGTDTIIATYIAKELEKRTQAISLFPIVYGVSEIHKSFSGTIYIKPRNFYMYVKDIVESLAKENVDNLLIINGHGANWFAINKACEDCKNLYKHIQVYQWWELIGEKYFKESETSHAGAQELSVLEYIDEKFVRLNKVENQKKNQDMEIILCDDIAKVTHNGVVGIATSYDKRKGEEVCEDVINIFTEIINEWENEYGNT